MRVKAAIGNTMPICEKCGREVSRLTVHAKSGKRLCLKCITESGFFTLSEDNRIRKDERRASIRLPVTVVLDFTINHTKKRFPAYTVDISMSGLCFGWNGCEVCHGYSEEAIDKNCVLYPYYITNPDRKKLEVELRITDSITIITNTFVVHTFKEESINLEYVGAKFVSLNIQNRRMLEKIVIMQGKNTEQ